MNSTKTFGTILIVDDTLENLRLLSQILTEHGYKVRAVKTGREAIASVNAELPDLILLDIKLPDIIGYDVCTHLKANDLTSAVPILFLSALNETEDKLRGFEVGGVDFITKPFRSEEVLVRIRTHLEISRLRAQLEAANKELEAFSYSISHDLRGPLRAIDGFSRILLQDYMNTLDDEGKRLLNIVSNNTRKMGQLIDDMLSFSRVGRKEIGLSEINMEKLAKEVLDELNPDAVEQKIEIVIKPLPNVHADVSMIRQVFVNLLSNAIKFTMPRADALIEVGCNPSVPSNKGGKSGFAENIYYVKDNGVGFDMKYASKLFGVFQRLHGADEFEGTGIGLAIVKRVIDKHGGRVWAEGKINEGATFSFTLPRAIQKNNKGD